MAKRKLTPFLKAVLEDTFEKAKSFSEMEEIRDLILVIINEMITVRKNKELEDED